MQPEGSRLIAILNPFHRPACVEVGAVRLGLGLGFRVSGSGYRFSLGLGLGLGLRLKPVEVAAQHCFVSRSVVVPHVAESALITLAALEPVVSASGAIHVCAREVKN